MAQTTMDTSVQTVRWTSGINAVAGAWLIVAPFILGYTSIGAALWNDMIVGVAILAMALGRVGSPLRNEGLSWMNFALGIWLVFAPWVLSYGQEAGLAADARTAGWNDLIVGIVVLVLAASSAITSRRIHPHTRVEPVDRDRIDRP